MKTPAEFEALCREQLDSPEALSPLPPGDSRVFCGFTELLAESGKIRM